MPHQREPESSKAGRVKSYVKNSGFIPLFPYSERHYMEQASNLV